MIANWIINVIGIVLFLFLFWKKLKEDYSSNIIFGFSFFILLGAGLGFLASKYFFPHWFFWFEAFGAFLGFTVGIIKYNTRFFETYEALFMSFMPWLALFFLTREIYISVFILGLIVLSVYLKAKYKTFLWYKSGKVGLVGLLISEAFFLSRAVVALLFPSVVSFLGLSDIVLSGVCVFTIFLLIYNLSKDD